MVFQGAQTKTYEVLGLVSVTPRRFRAYLSTSWRYSDFAKPPIKNKFYVEVNQAVNPRSLLLTVTRFFILLI